jgi:magnesium transporter
VLYAILDAVVDGYTPVVEGIANDIDEIETQVFDGDPKVSRRVYELNREVIEFERAVAPLHRHHRRAVRRVRRRLRRREAAAVPADVADHVVQAKERIEEFRVLLRDILASTLARRAASDRGGPAPLARRATARPTRPARSPAGPPSCSRRR